MQVFLHWPLLCRPALRKPLAVVVDAHPRRLSNLILR
jgi:hypothetical protein